MEGAIPFPPELRQFRPYVDSFTTAKCKQFGSILIRHLNLNIPKESAKQLIDEALYVMSQQDAAAQPMRNLRLVIRHDCQSTGCGDMSCVLCQYNPSRLCTRNVKQKYLIDDHLKAKCGAPLRVELVDDSGACHTEGLPPGVQLEMHVLNGEKYKELCPDNTLLTMSTIKNCIISHHTKALLRREGMPDDQLRVYLPLERGAAAVSDLALTTSSEALLSGKAPTFRLLVWAVDANGEPVSYVTYVVSESFVVATKRVKHAIKADVPSVGDHVSKLLHIGKATVDKLMDLRTAFQEEGFDVKLPDNLVRVEKVGQFRQLVEMSEASNDLKNKLRHVLKLSPEKWDEVCQHALSAVVPDFRNRVWWCMPLRLGLLYQCKNGAITMDNPIAIVRLGPSAEGPHSMVPLQGLPPAEFAAVPKLKNQALQSWYMPNHPNWAIYTDSAVDDGMTAPPMAPGVSAGPPGTLLPPAGGAPGGAAQGGMMPGMVGTAPGLPPMPGGGPYGMVGMGGPMDAYSPPMNIPTPTPYPDAGYPGMGGMMGGQGAPSGPRTSGSTPFAMMQPGAQGGGGPGAQGGQQQGGQQGGAGQEQGGAAGGSSSGSGMLMPGALGGGVAPSGNSNTSAGRSAFAATVHIPGLLVEAFPQFPGSQGGGGQGGQQQGGGEQGQDPRGGGGGPGPDPRGAHHAGVGVLPSGLFGANTLDMLKTEELMDRGMSVFGAESLTGNDAFRSQDWLPHLQGLQGGGTSSMGHGLQGGGTSQLAGVASYTMVDVPGEGDAGGQQGGGEEQQQQGQQGGGGGHHSQQGPGTLTPLEAQAVVDALGGGLDSRRLSLKLNSMSLDLDKVIAEHAGQ